MTRLSLGLLALVACATLPAARLTAQSAKPRIAVLLDTDANNELDDQHAIRSEEHTSELQSR